MFDTLLLREWFLWPFLSLWAACKLCRLTAVQLFVAAFFLLIFICAFLGEFLRVSLFTSVIWQSFSALIRGVWNPQAAIKTSYAKPSLHRFARVFAQQFTFTQVSATCPHPLNISASVVVPA